MKYFVTQIKGKKNGTWENGVIVKDTDDEARHQFHAFMSTYAYGQSTDLTYVSCTIETDDGRIIDREIDRREATEEGE